MPMVEKRSKYFPRGKHKFGAHRTYRINVRTISSARRAFAQNPGQDLAWTFLHSVSSLDDAEGYQRIEKEPMKRVSQTFFLHCHREDCVSLSLSPPSLPLSSFLFLSFFSSPVLSLILSLFFTLTLTLFFSLVTWQGNFYKNIIRYVLGECIISQA